MSKIFDAVQRGDGRLSEIILTSVLGQGHDVEQNGNRAAPARESDDDVATTRPAEPESTYHMVHLSSLDGNGGAPSFPLAVEISSTQPKQPDSPYNTVRLSPANGPLVFFDDNDLACEQYRILRTKIAQHTTKPRVILVSSAAAADGKTTTAINLATVLSLKSDADVLLIDGDFRRPAVVSQLGLPSSPGISDVVASKCALRNAIFRTEQFPSLCVLTPGDIQCNPAELLNSPAWAALCASVRDMFRFVVFDSPPISAVADYDLLQAVADGVILAAAPDWTPRKLLLKALQTVPTDKVIGVVLNRVPKWFLWKSIGHDYYRYYSAVRGEETRNRSH